jgi:TolB protein
MNMVSGVGDYLHERSPAEAQPAFSPDGKRVAFVRWMKGSWDVFVIDLATRRERRLTRSSADELYPAWSPEGARLLITRNRAPHEPVGDPRGR